MTNRRCLRVTTKTFSFFDVLRGGRRQSLQKLIQPLTFEFFHAQEFHAKLVFQHPSHDCHSNRDGKHLLWDVEIKCDHRAHREGTVRDNLAPAHPQVLYDSRREFDDISLMRTLVHTATCFQYLT